MPESEILWDCGMVRAILGRYEYTGALVQGKRQSIAVGSKVTRKSRDKDVKPGESTIYVSSSI